MSQYSTSLLTLDTAWSLGEQAFAEIVGRFRRAHAHTIVEFGSGVSTVRLAQAFPAASLLSVDHDDRFYRQTLSICHACGLGSRVSVDLRGIRWARYGLGLHYTYEAGNVPDSIDAVLIDGPPGWTCRGREACLYQVFAKLKVGGIVILDDASRHTERAAVAHWRTVYGTAIITEEIQIGHGLYAVTKLRDVTPSWLSSRLVRPALSSYYRRTRAMGARCLELARY
jgi:predicted O-methyltransferase YrrM